MLSTKRTSAQKSSSLYGIFTPQGVVSETNNAFYVRFAMDFIFYLYQEESKGLCYFLLLCQIIGQI